MGIKIVSDNKKARFNYQIIETYEAGLVLTGSEVKSIRAGHVSLRESYVSFKNHEAFLQGANIKIFNSSSYNNHEPERLRKLLLHREELEKMKAKIDQKGLTAVPTKIYFKGGRIKVEIGLGKGKKMHDKRESIKKKDLQRQMTREQY